MSSAARSISKLLTASTRCVKEACHERSRSSRVRRAAHCGETIPNNSSALFVVFKSLNMDKVLPEIEPYKPRVLKTSLSNEADRRFTAVLGKVA
jgi:hypothetical protein